MSRIVSDDADYVLIYDGENGLRMAPRAAAAAFAGEDPAELNVAQPEARLLPHGSRRGRAAAVIGAVIALGLVGFVAGQGWRLPGGAGRTVVPAAIEATPAARTVATQPEPTAAAAPRLRTAAPARHAHVAVRPTRVAAAKVRVRPPPAACIGARGRAEQMICRDPELTAQQARLDRALKSAAQAGVPAGDLEDGQTAWLAQRDTAVGRSRDEVAAAYRQRIEAVESLTNETPPF